MWAVSREISVEEREYREALAARLHAIRKARKLSLNEVARRADMDRVQLWGYERASSMPNPFTLDRLARALDVNPGLLLSGPKDARKNGKTGPER